MATLGIDFATKYDTDGYALDDDGRIRARGGALESFRPFDVQEALYSYFATLDDEPAAFVGFMQQFGPLTHNGHLRGERVEDLIERRRFMARLLELAHAAPADLARLDPPSPQRFHAGFSRYYELADRYGIETEPPRPAGPSVITAAAMLTATVQLAPPDGRPALCLAPDTLWDGMLLQLYQALGSGARLRACTLCGTWFEVGGGKGRRADARYCSPACQTRAYYHNSKRAKR